MVVLEWQLGIVGSAPWHSNRVHTSILESRETHNKYQWHNPSLVYMYFVLDITWTWMQLHEEE